MRSVGCECPLHQDRFNAGIQSLAIFFGKIASCENNDGDATPCRMLLYFRYELKPVHLRHHEVKNNDIRLALLAAGLAQRVHFRPQLSSQCCGSSQDRRCSRCVMSSSTTSTRVSPSRALNRRMRSTSLSRSIGLVRYPEAPSVMPLPTLIDDGGHDHRNIGERRIAAQRRQNRPAVDVRHHHVEGNRDRMALLGELEAFASTRRSDHGESGLTEMVRDQITRRRIIVNHQHAIAPGLHWTRLAGGVGGRIDSVARGERQADRKCRAFAGFAGHRHVATHHLAKPACDRQAEAGTAVVACGRCVGLGELLEQPGHLVGRHADAGIGHRELDDLPPLMLDRGRAQTDFTVLGELAGIAQEIEQNLPQPHGVGVDRRQIARTFDGQTVLVLLRE